MIAAARMDCVWGLVSIEHGALYPFAGREVSALASPPCVGSIDRFDSLLAAPTVCVGAALSREPTLSVLPTRRPPASKIVAHQSRPWHHPISTPNPRPNLLISRPRLWPVRRKGWSRSAAALCFNLGLRANSDGLRRSQGASRELSRDRSARHVQQPHQSVPSAHLSSTQPHTPTHTHPHTTTPRNQQRRWWPIWPIPSQGDVRALASEPAYRLICAGSEPDEGG